MKRHLIVFSLVMAVALLVLVSYQKWTVAMQADEHNRATVVLNSNTEHPQKILFYRDDCAACQSIYKFIFFEKVIQHDVVTVNLNAQSNRHYIADYAIKQVPTLVSGTQRYQGTDLKKMTALLRTSLKKSNKEAPRN